MLSMVWFEMPLFAVNGIFHIESSGIYWYNYTNIIISLQQHS